MSIVVQTKRWLPLLLISSLSLFMEVAAIRWLTAEIRLLAYFKNFVLLAAFLGLAIGFALVGKGRDYRFHFPLLWGLFTALPLIFIFTGIQAKLVFPNVNDEYFWYSASVSYWVGLILFVSIIIIFFLACMLLFIPLGQATGEEMALHPPVQAYIVNILASLFGVWVFSLLSFFQLPPVVWFGLGLAGIAGYFLYKAKLSLLTGIIFITTLVGIALAGRSVIWSPYNRLTLTDVYYIHQADNHKVTIGYELNVQNVFYQFGLDLTQKRIESMIVDGRDVDAKSLQITSKAYSLPYTLVTPQSRILVVGSGMGNDVAAALRNDMGQIDAVDIDPAILELGRKYHPENPYSDARVLAIVDDARSFFNKSSTKYDLVVFGLLDSHTLLSSLSSVRLDSYVYTLDSFREVQKHLNPSGLVSITFATNEWVEERLGRMLAEVYGPEKVSFQRNNLGTTFIAGVLSDEQLASAKLIRWQPNPAFDNLPLPTDDWPYLYLRYRNIPSGYWQALLVIALICVLIVSRYFPDVLKPDWHFFLLGAAFLLIEFKSVTELALLFGTTWFVNSLAISGVLVMALFANLFVLSRKRVDLRLIYILLFASLAFSYFFPLEPLAGYSAWIKALVGTLLLSLPLLFAGVIFSESLRRMGETAYPLASNFTGSAIGGLLEYGSLLWGIKSLYILAGFLYLGALFSAFKQKILR